MRSLNTIAVRFLSFTRGGSTQILLQLIELYACLILKLNAILFGTFDSPEAALGTACEHNQLRVHQPQADMARAGPSDPVTVTSCQPRHGNDESSVLPGFSKQEQGKNPRYDGARSQPAGAHGAAR